MTSSATGRRAGSDAAPIRSAAFSALVGLATLAVLLQGLWAGIFLQHDGQRDAASGWIDVHAAGAYVATLLGIAAAIVAVLRLRARRDLMFGSVAFAVLLLAETGLGSAIHDGSDGLTVVHVPLALFIMGLAVWLPLRARIGD